MVSAAPTPRPVLSDPGYSPKSGKTDRPTTSIRRSVVPTVIVTSSPTSRSMRRRVVVPSATSRGLRGLRPSSNGGSTESAAVPSPMPTAGTDTPSTWTCPWAAAAMAVTESTSSSRRPVDVNSSSSPLLTSTAASQPHP